MAGQNEGERDQRRQGPDGGFQKVRPGGGDQPATQRLDPAVKTGAGEAQRRARARQDAAC